MRAAGFRPATPALARMREISTDLACDSGGQHTPVGLRPPQSLLQRWRFDACRGAGRSWEQRRVASMVDDNHRARCSRLLRIPRLRALQVCRRRPTLGGCGPPRPASANLHTNRRRFRAMINLASWSLVPSRADLLLLGLKPRRAAAHALSKRTGSS